MHNLRISRGVNNRSDEIIKNYQSCKNKNVICDKDLSLKVYEINNRYYFSRK